MRHSDRLRVGWLNGVSFITSPGACARAGRSTTRAEDAQRTPTQSDVSPSILVYDDELNNDPCLNEIAKEGTESDIVRDARTNFLEPMKASGLSSY